MQIKLKLLIFLIALIATGSLQSQVLISGIVSNQADGIPVAGVEVRISVQDISTYTDHEGRFEIESEKGGIVNLTFRAQGFDTYFGSANTGSFDKFDMGAITIYPIVRTGFDGALFTDDDMITDEEGYRVSSLLTASTDIFDRAARFNFYAARFRTKGLESEFGTMYLNGMPVEDPTDGFISWSNWGGLNDVMRRQSSSTSLESPFFDFGSLGGSTNIDLSASGQWKQTRISHAVSNRSYRHRTMITHSSGMMDNGWAYSIAASRRWANEGYVPGTYYDAYSAFVSIDRKISEKHLLNFVTLATPNERGVAIGAVKEMYEIAGSNYYNANWGYQDGKKRNSRVNRSSQPLAILKHVWKFDKYSELSTSLGILSGLYGRSRLDWYSAPDPRADYYLYLPSYQQSEEMKAAIYKSLSENEERRQVNWNEIYEVNKASTGDILKTINYEGDISKERFSNYLIQEQRQDPTRIAFNTNIQTALTDIVGLNGGLSYVYQSTAYYQMAKDMLGGTFFLNYDKFAERDFPDDFSKIRQDINDPDRIIREGDHYGYNYDIVTRKAQGWAKASFTFNRIDAYASFILSNTSFYRDGKYKNGKFPDNSYGKSETHSFFNQGIKTGITFKFDGRNYIYGNALAMTKAPFARHSYLSPRTRDQIAEGLVSEKILSGEAAYVHRSPRFSLKAVAYYINIRDKTKISSFFHDDEQSFVNYIMTGINQLHYGTEIGAEYNISSSLSINGVAAVGRHIYNNRPTATITQDNSAEVLRDRTLYIKNYRIPGPQQAYSIGLRYNSPKFWFATISANYFNDRWFDFFPDRRTQEAVDGIDKNSNPELWYDIIQQEKLPADFTLDFFGGKSWRISNGKFIYLNAGVNNLLNNTNFITGGFEQFRFDFRGKNVDKFPSKYYYGYGTNYFISLTLRI